MGRGSKSQWPSSASICCPTIVSGVRFSQTQSFVEKDRKMGRRGWWLKEDTGSTIVCLPFIIILGHYGMFLWWWNDPVERKNKSKRERESCGGNVPKKKAREKAGVMWRGLPTKCCTNRRKAELMGSDSGREAGVVGACRFPSVVHGVCLQWERKKAICTEVGCRKEVLGARGEKWEEVWNSCLHKVNGSGKTALPVVWKTWGG